jgi:hypothetical protein
MIDRRIAQAKRDFLAGRIVADANGFISADGLTFKAPTAMAGSAGRTPAATATERWNGAIESALLEYNGDRKRATSMVARRQPTLRSALITEANSNRSKTAPVVAKPRASASQAFRQQVQELVDGGMTKLEAVKQLSRQAGLSIQPSEPNYFQDGKKRYFS